MLFRLHGIQLRYDQDSRAFLREQILRHLSLKDHELVSFSLVRRSIDARKKPVHLVYTVDCVTACDVAHENITLPQEQDAVPVRTGDLQLSDPPVVVGAGPAGLFAAYFLALHGYSPVVIERGEAIKKRIQDIENFETTRVPNPESNALFGLGGAGTYSDGKLTTSLHTAFVRDILKIFVEMGAPARILTDAKPHIGTDLLQGVVSNLAAKIEEMGGHIFTGRCLTGLQQSRGHITGVLTTSENIETSAVVLAIGHSARDTWQVLAHAGVVIEPKPFQIGVRVEHPQQWLDKLQYGSGAGHPSLGAADYKVTTRVEGTPVFSFCMCPGGHTIPTVNEPAHLCVNGMSFHKRNSPFSCSGIVVTLAPEVYGARDMQSALQFVRDLEHACFQRGGADYTAPAQRLLDLVAGKKSKKLPESSYPLGITSVAFDTLLPQIILHPLCKAMPVFNKRLPGFIHPDAVAIAPEARASSPLRIVRDRVTHESISMAGLYPAGEGAGYAGGIMSAALDGIHAALKIMERYRPLA